jgi:hypothetical protein
MQRARSLAKSGGLSAEELLVADATSKAASPPSSQPQEKRQKADHVTAAAAVDPKESASLRMAQYVDQKLREISGTDQPGPQPPPPMVPSRASLFVTPEHLKAESAMTRDAGEKTTWIAGIAEVELPASYRQRNIEETGQALAKLAEDHAGKPATHQPFFRRYAEPRKEH